MKKIFSALCFALFGVTAIMTSCSDVPAPYDIFGDGGDKGDGGEITEDNPFGLDLSNPVADFKADFEEQPDFTQDGEYSSNLNYDYTLEGWKNIASVGDRTWTGVVYKDNTKYIQASANKGNAEKYEAWFISPAFKVDEIKDKAVSFDCSGAYFNEKNSLKVYFLTLEDEKMVKTEVAVTGIPTSGSNYVWAKGLTADLSIFAGKTGCIGFCYNSYSANSTTYQLDNIKPGKGEGGSEITEDNPFGLDLSNPVADFKADFEEQPDFTQDGEYSSNLNYDYTLEGWKNIASVGDRTWTGVVYKDNTKYIQASANKGNAEKYEAWFISPAFKVDEIKDKAVSFDCSGAYFNAQNSLKVYFLTLENGKMIQTEVSVTGIPTSGSNYVWTKGLTADLSTFAGKTGCIGFCYNSYSANSTTYQLDNIKPGKGEGSSEGGETTEGNPFGLDPNNIQNSFSADFSDITDNQDYELAGWKNISVKGERRWQGKTYKTDKYIQATSYNGSGSEFECWFITPGFKVDEIEGKAISFDCAVYNYATAASNSKLEVYFLMLTDGNMTSEKIDIAGMPTTDNKWVTLSAPLSNFAGKTGYLGFKYTSTSSTEALSYRLDNIKAGANEGGGDTDPTPGGEFTSNINLDRISGSSFYKEKAKINEVEYDVVKIGTTSKPGSWTTPLAGGETTLTFYAIAWKGTGSTPLTISIENGGSFEDGSNSKEVTVTENAGATGSATGSAYTITLKGDNSELTELKLKDTTSSTTITFSANKRILFFGINLK